MRTGSSSPALDPDNTSRRALSFERPHAGPDSSQSESTAGTGPKRRSRRYYTSRADNLLGEFDPNLPTYGVYQNYRFFEERAKEAKAVIEAQGGDPEALTGKGEDSADGDDSSDSGNTPNVPVVSSQAQTANLTPVAVASDVVVDAISGATPILKPDPMQGWAIGEYEFDPPPLLGAIIDWITGGSESDAPQSSDQPGTSGGQVPGRPAASGAGTDSNGNVCSKATKSDGKVVTCVD